MFEINNNTNCEYTNFSAPASAGAVVTVNGNQLVPSPFVNLNLEKNISDDIIIGGLLRVQLNGMSVGGGFDEVAATGVTSIKEILELSATSDCVNVVIQCGQQFINGSGKIISASASEGSQPSWVNMAPYTIEIELYTNNITGKPYVEPENPEVSEDPDLKNLMLKNITENFSISIDEDSFDFGVVAGCNVNTACGVGRRHVKVSFNISATGIKGGLDECGEPEASVSPQYKYGLDAAETYITKKIDKLKTMDLSTLKNKPNDLVSVFTEYTAGKSYLDFRSLEVDPRSGTINVNGDIIYRPPGCEEDVFTQITVDENLDIEGNKITVSGTITGLVDIDYTKIIRAAKYLETPCTFNEKITVANAYFNKIKNENTIKSIALAHQTKPVIIDSCSTDGEENDPLASCFPSEPSTTPELCDFRLTSSKVSRAYAEGKIDFSFILSNKNDACSIPGVSNLEIEATHDIPRDNIVEILVPGRGDKGVLTQNLCVLSSEKWSFGVNLSLEKQGCKLTPKKTAAELRNCSKILLDQFIADLGEGEDAVDVSCWFVTDNQETIGRSSYRYNIQYTKPSCP